MPADSREFTFTGMLEEDGSLTLDGVRPVLRLLRPLKDKKLLIRFEEYQPKRSDAQNRYYWGVCIPIIKRFFHETEGIKYSNDEVHCFNIINVIGRKPIIKEVFGIETIVMEGKTTSQMTIKEFQDFKEKLQAYYAEKGCDILDPREQNLITDHIK